VSGSASTTVLSRVAAKPPSSATTVRVRKYRWSVGAAGSARRSSDGAAAARAPKLPAAAATALYRPNPLTRGFWPVRAVASMACSRVVNGPDSTTSVDSTPSRATAASTGHRPVDAYTTPVPASARYSTR
jgi:hypothetical protein